MGDDNGTREPYTKFKRLHYFDSIILGYDFGLRHRYLTRFIITIITIILLLLDLILRVSA